MHTPSEHTIDEQYYDLELQLSHAGPGGKTLVVSVLFSAGEGITSPAWLRDIVRVVQPCHLGGRGRGRRRDGREGKRGRERANGEREVKTTWSAGARETGGGSRALELRAWLGRLGHSL